MTNLNSKIEWTDSTWNIVAGCTKVSPGCDHCYAEKITERFRGKGSFAEVKPHPDRLDAPLRWRKPRRVFVNSMSDLFHDEVSDGLIAAVWFVMGQCAGCIPEQYRGHTFQILTKRHARMRSWLRRWSDVGEPGVPPMDKAALRCGRAELIEQAQEFIGPLMYDWMDGPRYWPRALPGVWLGVSVEDQKRADLRIPTLLETPAAFRFISAEPLLGPVDLRAHLAGHCPEHDFPGGFCVQRDHPGVQHLGWVIAGGESGPGARPCDPEWIRALLKQCHAAGVPAFVKQLGSKNARAIGGDSKGGDPALWPVDLRVREFPGGAS